MEKFELTEEQWAQVRAVQRRITLTDNQKAYMRRARAEEEEAREENIAEARRHLLSDLSNRVRTLETALNALIAGNPEQARAVLDRK
jgi:hypothetical protein